jgi:hypothetical protein
MKNRVSFFVLCSLVCLYAQSKTVFELNNELDLLTFLNSGNKRSIDLILSPDSNNEFRFSGEISNNPNYEKDGVSYIFDGYSDLSVKMLNSKMRIVFEQRHCRNELLACVKNNTLWGFQNSKGVVLEALNILTKPQKSWHPSFYNRGGVLDFISHNHNVTIKNNFISGHEIKLKEDGPNKIIDLYQSSAITIGRDKKSDNTHFEISDNYLTNFRFSGMYITDLDRSEIYGNHISNIWEDNSQERAQAGGIHIAYSQFVNIYNNQISNVYSLFGRDSGGRAAAWDPGMAWGKGEHFQHGIYISEGNKNLVLESNHIKGVSGLGVKISGKLEALNSRIIMINNFIEDAFYAGLGVSGVSQINISGNTFKNCGAILNNLYLYDGNEQELRKRRFGVMTLSDRAGGARIKSIVLKDNLIQTNRYEMFGSLNEKSLGLSFNYFLKIRYSHDLISNLADRTKVSGNLIEVSPSRLTSNGVETLEEFLRGIELDVSGELSDSKLLNKYLFKNNSLFSIGYFTSFESEEYEFEEMKFSWQKECKSIRIFEKKNPKICKKHPNNLTYFNLINSRDYKSTFLNDPYLDGIFEMRVGSFN